MSFIMTIRPKLVTFDVTGTLLKYPMHVGQQYAKVGLTFGLKADPELLQSNFKLVYKQMLKDHPNFGQVTGIGWESWWKRLVDLTFKKSLQGIEIDSSKMQDISKRIIDVYRTSEGWTLANGTVELLDWLRNKNLQLGVISNYDPRLEGILKHFKIIHYFDFVISSYNVKLEKPDKKIFNFVEDLSKKKPNEILHVGDSIDLDFFGAKNAGWSAILIHTDAESLKKKYPEIDTKYVVKDLLAVKEEISVNV